MTCSPNPKFILPDFASDGDTLLSVCGHFGSGFLHSTVTVVFPGARSLIIGAVFGHLHAVKESKKIFYQQYE